MKIKSIEIKELYGLYDHKIEFNRNEKIDIVIGQNGIGKTTILKLLYMLFNHQISQIKNIRFKEFIIEFDPGFCLIFKEICKDNYFIDYDIFRSDVNVHTSTSVIEGEAWQGIKNIRDFMDDYSRYEESSYIHRPSGRIMCFEETYYSVMSQQEISVADIYPQWLSDTLGLENVCFIEAQRLQTNIISQRSMIRRYEIENVCTLKVIANELSGIISNAQQRYAEKSVELDESYPYRLVENLATISSNSLSSQKTDILELSQYRYRLIRAGLLGKKRWEEKEFIAKSRSTYIEKAISLYIQDSNAKFDVFRDELERIERFMTLVNNRLLNKEIIVDKERGLLVKVKNSSVFLELDKLSSGEQNLIILYYDLIFKYPNGALILIDEPEISLHIAWQKRFVSEIKSIIKFRDLHVMIATHSPNLISRYWGLTHELDKDIIENELEE